MPSRPRSRPSSRGTGIAALVHNAGVMTKERSTSVDGYELTLATHVLGPLLLTELLTPLLAEAAPSKVVFVTSGGMYTEKLDVDDLDSTTASSTGPPSTPTPSGSR